MSITTSRSFFLEAFPDLLSKLKADTEPRFGLMTAQHMLEHLLNDEQYMFSRLGEPEGPPTDRQLGFQAFIAKGAIMKHRPTDKTKADLPELKFASFEEAVEKILPVPQKFYDHFDAQPDFKVYNSFMGEMGFELVELFFRSHWSWHFYQFKLIDKYPLF